MSSVGSATNLTQQPELSFGSGKPLIFEASKNNRMMFAPSWCERCVLSIDRQFHSIPAHKTINYAYSWEKPVLWNSYKPIEIVFIEMSSF